MIAKLFPDGILCMESALDFYEYTERIPSAWHIAVDNRSSRERFSIDSPIVEVYFTEPKRLNLGVFDGCVDRVSMKIYDRERTICDCMRNRDDIDGLMSLVIALCVSRGLLNLFFQSGNKLFTSAVF